LALSVIPLTACDWVDSTGLQRSSIINPLADGDTLVLIEELPTSAQLVGTGQTLSDWEWRSEGPGNLDACLINPDFDVNYAFQSFDEACADQDDCQVDIQENSSGGSTSFSFQIPSMRFSAAEQYLLTATDEDGQETQRRQTICSIAINDPPVAVDNEYLVPLIDGLFVPADAENSVLANDFDDDDARNLPLQVDPIAVRAPEYANAFELFTDGSFYYQAREDAPMNEQGVIEDFFIYSLSDGNESTQATVSLRVVAVNSAPQQRSTIPNINLALDEAPFDDVNVADYFFDPDGDELTFFATSSSFPESGSMQLRSDGTLQMSPTEDETGTWRVTVTASDNLDQVSASFLIRVQTGNTPNTAPTAEDIPNRRVSDEFEFAISQHFEDEDGDELEFFATGLPDDVFISSNGVISGVATDDNEGRWIVTITAYDGRGGEVSDSFRLQIIN